MMEVNFGILGLFVLILLAAGVISLIVLLWRKGGPKNKKFATGIITALIILTVGIFILGSLRGSRVVPTHQAVTSAHGSGNPQIRYDIKLLGPLFGAAGVLLVFKGGSTGRKIARAILAASLVVLAAGLFFYVTRPKITQVETVRPIPVPEISTSNATQIENIPFPANTYPSMELAAQALAREAMEMLPDLVPDKQIPGIVQIWGSYPSGETAHRTKKVSNEALIISGNVLRDEGHIEKVLVESVIAGALNERITSIDKNGITVELRLNSNTTSTISTPWDNNEQRTDYLCKGILEMSLWGRERHVCLTQEFICKPWAADFAAFVSKYPQQRWLRSVSPQLMSSEQDAQMQAVAQAVAQLRPLVRIPGQVGDPDAYLRRMVNEQLIVDRYVQRFSRPYGDVYREMLLLDVSPHKLGPLEAQITAETKQTWRSQRRTWIGHLASLAGLFVLICVVYVFLNAATRGYYVWSLRIAAIVLALVGAAMIYIHLRSTGTLP